MINSNVVIFDKQENLSQLFVSVMILKPVSNEPGSWNFNLRKSASWHQNTNEIRITQIHAVDHAKH